MPPDPRPATPAQIDRESCLRCRRPRAACFCAHLPSLQPRTHVVFLQHPRERRVAISTCRMAHLAFHGSELHHGVTFDGDAHLEALASPAEIAAGRAFVLFPGPGAIDPATLAPGQLRTLFVVDGTWPQARKIIQRSALLGRLPRLGLEPARPGNYRIRREPAPHCVATIEAVVEVLSILEGEPDRFHAALAAFDYMVDFQIEKRAARTTPPRTKRKRQREPKRLALPAALLDERLTLVYAEANPVAPPELLHLLAVRPATGARFEARVRPRSPLSPSAPHQIELDAAPFLDGEPAAAALDRFAAFAGPAPLLAGWGRFAADLIHGVDGADRADAERAGTALFTDLRPAASRLLRRRAGGLEEAAALLDPAPAPPWTGGRGGRRIAALSSVLAALRADRA